MMILEKTKVRLNEKKFKEEKIKFLRDKGYIVFDKITQITKEILDNKIKIAGVNISGYKGGGNSEYSYYRIVDDGFNGEIQSYTLDCYGNLVYMTHNDSPGENDIKMYYEGKEFSFNGYEYPDIYYVIYNGNIIYAGYEGGVARILKLMPDDYEVINEKNIGFNSNMEDYLIDSLVYWEKVNE